MNWLPINWELAGNPYNWVVVPLMIVMVMFFFAMIFPSVAQEQSQ